MELWSLTPRHVLSEVSMAEGHPSQVDTGTLLFSPDSYINIWSQQGLSTSSVETQKRKKFLYIAEMSPDSKPID